ncbi:dsDNA nuclease domain-containing protein [Klebsiella pneumoniae]|uniref:dsDNA nuclease domain-containing protein n=1 Tax=Klebsiella pneumoniae TaxID=573 RepID=UPI000C12B7AB|nr:dsDNA nuclease domain-containing protein [Klebsiella pneumoniae]MCC3233022.1 dsDNA nuclease domain-containing protein [Klebsiella pneumoniae]MCM6125436.1 dsDNA nuclease domain-containing protein [Klebsiella pneumoniae]MCP5606820.1 dsDNA nuclease domain-containing protein [Klebsiella pneumoniae]MCP6384873.1 dsDNA nuclease domain-containing protein [Klebsiella pneumoniae]MDE1746158.1 dsDNA nuclease domain-containing protein [Klebsiella pneumoniae subsp. pneumoniae]
MEKEIPLYQNQYGLPKDRAAEIRRAYQYQDSVGAQLLILAVKNNCYTEVWFEHYEDIIALKADGYIDVYQVKTKISDSKWKSNDAEIIKTISRFCELEKLHGQVIQKYFFHSNNDVYIPQSTSTIPEEIVKSPLKIKELFACPEMDEKLTHLLNKWVGKIDQPYDILVNVLAKIEFIKGKSLTGFQYEITADLATLPKIRNLSHDKIKNISDDLLSIINKANSLDTTSTNSYLSIIDTNGLSKNQNLSKRVKVCEIKKLINAESNKIRNRKIIRILSVATVIIILFIIAFLNLKPESLLERSVRIINSSRSRTTPPEFDEAISAIRSNDLSLEGIDLSGANIQCKDMSKLNLRRSVLTNLMGTGVNFDNAKLYLSQFNQSELNASSFNNTIMDGANFQDANMLGSSLKKAIARNSNFSKTTLNGANLSDADFYHSNFSSADLSQSELISANLQHSILTNANLTDANITNTDLRDSIGLKQNMLDKACFSPKQPPLISPPLTLPKQSCYKTEAERDDRYILQYALKVTGMMAVINGFCDKGKVIDRPSDVSGRPDLNIEINIEPNTR